MLVYSLLGHGNNALTLLYISTFNKEKAPALWTHSVEWLLATKEKQSRLTQNSNRTKMHTMANYGQKFKISTACKTCFESILNLGRVSDNYHPLIYAVCGFKNLSIKENLFHHPFGIAIMQTESRLQHVFLHMLIKRNAQFLCGSLFYIWP